MFKVLLLLACVGASVAQKCHQGICDVMIVVDRSKSIGRASKAEQHFVEDLINLQFQKYADPKVGLVTFGGDAWLKQELTNDQQKLHNKVDNWGGLSLWTYTDKGIKVARAELDDHARTDCRKMYVITDGKAVSRRKDRSKYAIKEANAARKQGIEVFAVGVGKKVDKKELQGIADPGPNHLWMVDTFDQADDAIVKNDVCLQNAACPVKPTKTEGGSWQCGSPTAHGGTCNMVCDHPPLAAGNGIAKCNNGVWEDYADEKCPAASCSDAPVPVQYGLWNCDPGLPKTSGDSCALECDYGLIAGDGTATCHDGSFGQTDKDDKCAPPSCPSNTWAKAGSTYKFSSSPMSWNEAQAEATAMGGFLVSISTEAEQNFIKNQVFKTTAIKNAEYWMGIFSDHQKRSWQWASHADFSYSNWEPGNGQFSPDEYGVINDEYVRVKRANHLAKWSSDDNSDMKLCGLVEIPPKLECMCDTTPQDKTCAPQECNTLRTQNTWNLVMCRFEMQAEFGNDWKETTPNHFTSGVGAGWSCSPAPSAKASLCP